VTVPKPEFLILDTKDDRREVHRLLSLLSPAERLDFIRWCCRQVYLPNSRINPQPSRRMQPRFAAAMRDDRADERLVMEQYMDFWQLANIYKLNVVAAAKELERRVKAKR
jgi:hypothetical protein